jgi:hypothetical protein
MADRVESVIRDRIAFLAENPGAGHWRKNLTDQAVKFFPGLLLPDCLSSRDQASANSFRSARMPRCGKDSERSSVRQLIRCELRKGLEAKSLEPVPSPPTVFQSRVVSGLMMWVKAKVWFCDPLTCATSSGVRIRAPMRPSTLWLSCWFGFDIVFPLSIGQWGIG